MPDLKLAKLPDRTPIKVVVLILPDLAQSLEDYAAAYEQAYGKREEVAALIPHMLIHFLDSDRSFARGSRK